MTNTRPMVIVIDDDPSILRALRRLISGTGFDIRTFDRPSAFLGSELPTARACLIVDVNLPEMNGVDLCAALAASGCRLPIILITGHTDEQTRARQSIKTALQKQKGSKSVDARVAHSRMVEGGYEMQELSTQQKDHAHSAISIEWLSASRA